VNLPYPDYFYDLGGMSALAIDGNDDLWLGTIEGLVHYDGQTFTLYDQSNTPMPASSVRGIDFRSDGVIGLSLSEYVGTVPYPHGACVVDGPIGDPASWSIYSYQDGYLPHYQLGRCSWDADGNFWVSTLGEGSFVLHLGPPAVPGDMDGDGDVDLDDHASFVECLAGPEVAPSPGEPLTAEECLTVFDFDEGGDVDLRDYSVFIESFGVGSS
jgi:hypothetical protein